MNPFGIFLIMGAFSMIIWIVRIWRFSVLMRVGRPRSQDVGAGFEERIEARLAAMASEKRVRGEEPSRSGFGRRID